MTAYLVLASIAVLLGLLIHGRFSPAILFATWAGGYTLLGLSSQQAFLSSFTNTALATLILLLLSHSPSSARRCSIACPPPCCRAAGAVRR